MPLGLRRLTPGTHRGSAFARSLEELQISLAVPLADMLVRLRPLALLKRDVRLFQLGTQHGFRERVGVEGIDRLKKITRQALDPQRLALFLGQLVQVPGARITWVETSFDSV